MQRSCARVYGETSSPHETLDASRYTRASMVHAASASLSHPFALEVETEFAAAHAIVIEGVREPMHGHNWRVVVCVGGAKLDNEELLCDFHALDAYLRAIVAPFVNRTLNDVAPFDTINPSAEAVARHIAHSLAITLATHAPHVFVEWVRVTEAPRCTAIVRHDSTTRSTNPKSISL